MIKFDEYIEKLMPDFKEHYQRWLMSGYDANALDAILRVIVPEPNTTSGSKE
jgi:hypothetical protein